MSFGVYAMPSVVVEIATSERERERREWIQYKREKEERERAEKKLVRRGWRFL